MFLQNNPQDQQRCEIIRKHMKDLGFPTIDPIDVFNELPKIWESLETAGVIPKGWTYKGFVTYVKDQYRQAEHFDRLQAQFTNPYN